MKILAAIGVELDRMAVLVRVVRMEGKLDQLEEQKDWHKNAGSGKGGRMVMLFILSRLQLLRTAQKTVSD